MINSIGQTGLTEEELAARIIADKIEAKPASQHAAVGIHPLETFDDGIPVRGQTAVFQPVDESAEQEVDSDTDPKQ